MFYEQLKNKTLEDLDEVLKEAKEAAHRLDKVYGENSRVQVFVNEKGLLDFICLKSTEEMSSGYTMLQTVKSRGLEENQYNMLVELFEELDIEF